MAIKENDVPDDVVMVCPHCPGLTFTTISELIQHTAETHDPPRAGLPMRSMWRGPC